MSEILPEGWETVELASVASITMGQSPLSNNMNTDRIGLPFFQGNADFGAHRPIAKSWCDDFPKKAAPYSILYSVRAPVGEINRFANECAIGRGLAAILPTKADPDYLYHYLGFTKVNMVRLAQGSTFEAINGQELKSFAIRTPPLPQQKKIAAILTSVDDVIENTQAQIAKLQDLKKATMNELLTKGIGHTEFKDSALGRIPKSWAAVSLLNVINVLHGFQFREHHFSKGGIPVVKIGNLTDGGFVNLTKSPTFVPFEVLNSFQKFKLYHGDTLMALTGATLGKVSIYNKKTTALQNYRVGKFVTRDERKLLQKLVYWILQSGYVQKVVEDMVNEAAQPNIGKADLENIRIPLPPVSEQEIICETIEAIHLKIQIDSNRLLRFFALKKALMNDLLTGKVRVNVN